MYTLKKSQRSLLLIWLIGLAPSLVLISVRTIVGAFDTLEQEVWSWFVPMFLPSVTLMIGAYSKVALDTQHQPVSVDTFFFKLSIGLSVSYLLSLFLVIVYQPFADDPALVVFRRSSLFLAVIQGFTAACLGVFFMSQKLGDSA